MKITTLSVALSATLGLTSAVLAVDYSSSVPSDRNWDGLIWQPVGTPGSEDIVTDITAGATKSIYMNGNRALGELHKTTNTNIRFYNGALDATEAAASTFDIGTLNIERGGYLFRSQGETRLTTNVGVVKLGDPYTPGAPQPPVASLTIGSDTGLANVSFSVADRTELHHRVNLLILNFGDSLPQVNLGHVIYNNASAQISQIQIGSTSGVTNTDFRVKAGSLSTVVSPTENNTNLIRGTGVLELTGNLDDPKHPGGGVSSFEGLIQDAIRLEKTGSDIQILSRPGGSTYSGGTLITNGVLSVRSNVSSATGRGEVLVTERGTLAGSGIIIPGAGNEIVVRNGGRLAPSADLSLTPQKLRLSGVNHGSSPLLRAGDEARFAFNFFESGNDEIEFLSYSVGNFLIDAADGAWVDISGDIREGVYVLFSFRNGKDNHLVASGLSEGLLLGEGFDGYTATFHYDSAEFGGVGTIALELRAIPEPGHFALLLIAGAAWAIVARQRKVSSISFTSSMS